MKSIYFCLKYCYGIKSFDYTFLFDDQKKAHIIYAPNGTMKSSFANTLRDLSSETFVDSRDRYFPDLPYMRIVKHGDAMGRDLGKEEVFVVESRKEYYYTEKMSLLLANERLKSSYDRIHRDLDDKVEKVINLLVKHSGRKDPKPLFCKDFGIAEKDFVEELCRIYNENVNGEIPDYSTIKYSSIFSEDTEKILANPEVIVRIENYIQQLSILLTTSIVFRPIFSHTSAEDTLARLDKSGFFKADHKVVLQGQEEKLGSEEYKKTINDEKKRIINEGLADEFKQLDVILSSKNATQEFRKYLYEHQDILPQLRNISEFKKSIWVSYLFAEAEKLMAATTYYESSRPLLQQIIDEANEQLPEWYTIVEQFNSRFIDMPFTLDIDNKLDVILEEKAPSLIFKIKDGGVFKPVERELLLECLSEGEKRALYLLNVLFNIEALKKRGQKLLLVIDDIADSFDYKNKYAIIEYLTDIVDSQKFYPVILTHNFDFYRTLASRAGLEQSIWFAEKNGGNIGMIEGEYTKNVFLVWKGQVYSNQKILIASIAFLRNLVEYQQGKESVRFLQYTFLLHYKKNPRNGLLPTERILVRDYIDYIVTDWQILEREKFIYNEDLAFYTIIMETADSIAGSPESSVKLENKICLSIAIRLLAEKYMIYKISDDSKTDLLESNQTRKLRNLVAPKLNAPDEVEKLKLIDRVLIMTSENIHINSFMYEPIIDLSLDELKNLYNDVSGNLRI